MKDHRPVRFPKKPSSGFEREVSNIVYGKNAVTEVLRAGRRKVLEFYASAEFEKSLTPDDLIWRNAHAQRLSVRICNDQELGHICKSAHHQGVVARVGAYPLIELDQWFAKIGEKALVLMLDSVTDPQNFGALCRSALAFGVDAVILPKDRSIAVTPSVCKASSGAVEHLNIIQVGNLVVTLNKFKEHKFWIYGAHLKVATTTLPALDPAGRSVLVVGSEGKGIRELVGKTCDVLFTIPMAADFDSLNVAQAGTVCLYEMARKMGKM